MSCIKMRISKESIRHFLHLMIAKYWHRFQRPKLYAIWVLGFLFCSSHVTWQIWLWHLKTFPMDQMWPSSPSVEVVLNPTIQKDSQAVLGMRIRAYRSSENSTSSSGSSPRSKWRSEKPLAKAAVILHESWSILPRDTWWNGFFGGCFQRLAAPFVLCNRKPLFKQNEDISSCLCDEILTNFWSHFGSLGQAFLRPPFWTRRRPWGRGCRKLLGNSNMADDLFYIVRELTLKKYDFI